MDSTLENKMRTVKSLIIFVIVFNLIAWLGFFIEANTSPDAKGLGLTVWLVSPLLVSIVLRVITKDWKDLGIRPSLKANWGWYLFSLFAFPVIVFIVIIVGVVFGAISLENFDTRLFFGLAGAAFGSTFIKNIFEEFAWRGYLTPKVDTLGLNRIVGHLIVGAIWGIWHIPYYLGLLDRATLSSYTPLPVTIFVPLLVLSMIIASVMFGELRLRTQSTWPAVLMHTMSNIIILTLLTERLVDIPTTGGHVLFTPSWEGVLSLLLIAGVGLLMVHLEHKNEFVRNEHENTTDIEWQSVTNKGILVKDDG